MQVVHFIGAKGGVGTSSAVALCAAALAAEGRRVGVIDATKTGDLASVLDDNTKTADRPICVLANLDDLIDAVAGGDGPTSEQGSDGLDIVLVDHVACPSAMPPTSSPKVLVTRNCFLAVNRGLQARFVPTGVIVMRDRHRSIQTENLEAVLSIPARSALEIPIESAIARWVDAGLVASIPAPILRALGLAEFIHTVCVEKVL